MNFIRKFVLPVAGVAAVALLIAIASPQAVHAITAALVQIANTPTTAVPAIQAPAESQIYRNLCSVFPNGSTHMECTLPSVPAGQTLFLETVSIDARSDPGLTPYIAYLTQFPNGIRALNVPMSAPITAEGVANSAGTVGGRVSFPAGSAPTCDVWFTGDVHSGSMYCHAFGYLAPAQ